MTSFILHIEIHIIIHSSCCSEGARKPPPPGIVWEFDRGGALSVRGGGGFFFEGVRTIGPAVGRARFFPFPLLRASMRCCAAGVRGVLSPAKPNVALLSASSRLRDAISSMDCSIFSIISSVVFNISFFAFFAPAVVIAPATSAAANASINFRRFEPRVFSISRLTRVRILPLVRLTTLTGVLVYVAHARCNCASVATLAYCLASFALIVIRNKCRILCDFCGTVMPPRKSKKKKISEAELEKKLNDASAVEIVVTDALLREAKPVALSGWKQAANRIRVAFRKVVDPKKAIILGLLTVVAVVLTNPRRSLETVNDRTRERINNAAIELLPPPVARAIKADKKARREWQEQSAKLIQEAQQFAKNRKNERLRKIKEKFREGVSGVRRPLKADIAATRARLQEKDDAAKRIQQIYRQFKTKRDVARAREIVKSLPTPMQIDDDIPTESSFGQPPTGPVNVRPLKSKGPAKMDIEKTPKGKGRARKIMQPVPPTRQTTRPVDRARQVVVEQPTVSRAVKIGRSGRRPRNGDAAPSPSAKRTRVGEPPRRRPRPPASTGPNIAQQPAPSPKKKTRR